MAPGVTDQSFHCLTLFALAMHLPLHPVKGCIAYSSSVQTLDTILPGISQKRCKKTEKGKPKKKKENQKGRRRPEKGEEGVLIVRDAGSSWRQSCSASDNVFRTSRPRSLAIFSLAEGCVCLINEKRFANDRELFIPVRRTAATLHLGPCEPCPHPTYRLAFNLRLISDHGWLAAVFLLPYLCACKRTRL